MTAVPSPDPAMAAILARLAATPAPDWAARPLPVARALFEAGAGPWRDRGATVASSAELTVPGATEPMRARLLRPAEGRLPLILYVHGGGWTFGSVDTHDTEMRHLARASGAAVLGIDYRLAPEHPFPAPLDDVRAALAFCRAGGLGVGIDADRIAIAGDSAGANLALAALIAERDAGAPPLRAAGLFYGCYAPDFATASHARCGDGRFPLSTARMRWYWANYLGTEGEGTTTLAAPSRARLDGLPPLYLNAAGLDPLLDDTTALAARLAAAGVSLRLDVVPGVVHGFHRMVLELPAARRALAAAGRFIGERFDNEKVTGGD